MDIKKIFRLAGPGVITGAADDDPSGIATYSQAGAQFGYSMLWTAIFMLPLQIAIQEACARIGAVTGKGIAAVIKEHYNNKLLSLIVSLLLIANTINIGADIGAMAEATQLILPINFVALTLSFTVIILLLEIFISYRVYAKILKWLCLFLLAYPITLCLIDAPWLTIIKATVIPHIEFNFQFLFIMTGVLGTTISPYLFFWQASEEVEEAQMIRTQHGRFQLTTQYIQHLRIDNFTGMLFSEMGAWSIIVVTAVTLNGHGITDIKTAADAAKALEPLVHTFSNAGYLAKLIFATGIIGLGFLAIPVLAASAAYAVAEAFGWHVGLHYKLAEARGFYIVLIIATCVGLLINFIGINPVKALIYAAVINGIIAVPLIFIIALIARNEKIMGTYKSGWLSILFVWITCIVMTVAAITMLVYI